jgi:hypothetical protein
MCGDYHPINKWICKKNAMPMSENIFDTLKQAKVFNILDI